VKKILLQVLLGALAVTGVMHGAHAAGYPEKAVKIIVPQSAGGGTDMLARLLAQKLSERWGQAVFVENKPGAGGIIGLQFVAKSPNDGYTLLMSSDGPQAINVSLYKSLPYDPVKDFTPIATVGSISFLLAAGKDLPAKDFAEFVKMSRTAPNFTFGSAGNGSLNHLIGEMINQSTHSKLTHVPYKGAAAATTDLLGGRLTTVVASVPSIAAHIESGALRGLAVTSAQRSARLPNVPTISEFGYLQFGVSPWIGLLAPANLPADLVSKINTDVNSILQEAEVKEKILGQGMEPLATTPEQFQTLLNSDIEKWRVVVKKSGVTVN
jgi:tripartite-type tricarboxylate transporter receptor subunit TctC